jgi:heme/copper-type cytochrome/quinol oxidase subunit 3
MVVAPATVLPGVAKMHGVPDLRPHRAVRTGVLLFLATEVMFFAGLVSAAIVLRAADPGWRAASERLEIGPAVAGTVLLLASSLVVALAARRARRAGAAGPLRAGLVVAALLGAAFLALQAFEYRALLAEGVDWRSGVFGSTFWTLTAVHGLHVLAGVAWLALVALARPGTIVERAELAGWYWHLVDGVWLVLFTLFHLL